MTYRVLSITEVGTYPMEYHIELEITSRSFFGGRQVTRQQYRGRFGWRLYPQGSHLYDEPREFLNEYVQQYQWAKEMEDHRDRTI